jgi:hypothetical protein
MCSEILACGECEDIRGLLVVVIKFTRLTTRLTKIIRRLAYQGRFETPELPQDIPLVSIYRTII